MPGGQGKEESLNGERRIDGQMEGGKGGRRVEGEKNKAT